MSTIAVNTITDASGGNTASINGATPTTDNTMGRNRIINGDMRIDQRNAGAAVSTDGSFVVDRFKFYEGVTSATATGQQSTDAPSGFKNSLVYTVGTGASPGATDYAGIQQRIEGYNIADFGFGTSDAKTFTLSFWVKSSVTGTFGVSFRNSGSTRSYIDSYTINSANTWEYKTITITGDTSGTWSNDNEVGISCFFDLGVGSTYSTTAGSWQAGNFFGLTGGAKLSSTSGATFYITGVQLEAGSVATSFERRSYGTELQLCKRYYQRYTGGSGNYGYIGLTMGVGSGTNISVMFPFEQEMRAAPSRSYDVTGLGCWDGVSLRAITAVGAHYINTKGARVDMTVGGGGLVAGNSYSCYGSSSTIIQLNAEL
jgi:hypothetical protein